ncbi:MAG: hypothetical protein K6U04_13875 [Armatimonadetes bacterium]|nr:hypothetical protein [Armatimonadota bacterium]
MTEQNIQAELIAFFIQDLPESIIMTLVVFSFLNLRFAWRKVLTIAFLQALVNFVRLLPIAAGMHTVILIIFLAVLISIFTGTRLSKSLMVVLICSVIILFLSLIYTKPLLQLTGLTYEASFANPFLRALFSLPYEILLLVVAIGKNYYNRRGGKFPA